MDAQFDAKQELAIIKNKLNENFDELTQKKQEEREDLKKYEDAADADVKEIRIQYAKNKDAVCEILMKNVMNVNLNLPKVVVGNFEEMTM